MVLEQFNRIQFYEMLYVLCLFYQPEKCFFKAQIKKKWINMQTQALKMSLYVFLSAYLHPH